MLTTDRPLRVAVLCSRRAPGLVQLLDDPAHGTSFDIVGLVTSEDSVAEEALIRERGLDPIRHPIASFYEARGSKVYRDFVTRRAYDRATVDLLAGLRPDLVLLDGYLYLLTKPMLEAWRSRMLNLHFSDLTIRTVDRRPAYAGIRAVRDAIADGQAETSATVHLVTDEPDGGPPLIRSWAFPVAPVAAQALRWQAADMLKAYAYAHQEWMIRAASGPLWSSALQVVASGLVDLEVLGGADPSRTTPWQLDEHGRITPPAAARMQGILDGYKRARA